MTTLLSRQPSPTVDIRQAAAEDLVAAARIQAAGDVEMVQRMHPRAGLTLLNEAARVESSRAALQARLEEDPRQVWLARDGERVVGVASAAFRGRHAHIQSFFVVPAAQQRGIGEGLLAALHAAAEEAGCQIFTLQASDDPRALTRYFHLGLLPQPPNVVWTATVPQFPALGLDHSFEMVPLVAGDQAVLNTATDIDKAVRGAPRAADVRRWLREGATGALLVDHVSGVPTGYFLVAAQAGIGRIGPVAAVDAPRFAAVLTTALAAAADLHAPEMIWRAAVPGENRSAVEPLLAAGFRPTFTMTFFASAPLGRFDRYLFHDLDLL